MFTTSVHYANTPMQYAAIFHSCKKNSDENHNANMSVQYTAIFHGCKNDNFQMKYFVIFLIFAQNIDCGYTLEPLLSNIFSETAWPINAKFHVEPPWERGNEILYKWSRLHDEDGRHAHLW